MVDGAEIWDFYIKESGRFSALVQQRQTFFVVYCHMTLPIILAYMRYLIISY